MNWAAKIMPVRVLDYDGFGSNSDITDGITWAATHGADIINLSLGGTTYSQAMQDAVTAAHNSGVLVIAAMGNCRVTNSSCPTANPDMYPAKFDHVMAVAATAQDDAYAYYSQYGDHCDIAAPGGEMGYQHDPGGIYSSLPTYPVYFTSGGYYNDYDYLQGTVASGAAGGRAGRAGLDVGAAADAGSGAGGDRRLGGGTGCAGVGCELWARPDRCPGCHALARHTRPREPTSHPKPGCRWRKPERHARMDCADEKRRGV